MLKRAILSLSVVLCFQGISSADVIVGYGLDNSQPSLDSKLINTNRQFVVRFTTGTVAQVLTNVQAQLAGLGIATVSFYDEALNALSSASTGVASAGNLSTFSGFAPTTFQANSSYLAVFSGSFLGSGVILGSTGGPSPGATGTINNYYVGVRSSGSQPFSYSSVPIGPVAFQINGSNVSPPVVPEPSSLALLGVLSLTGLGVKRFRGRRSQDVADAHVAV
jgi:hypothetical protein